MPPASLSTLAVMMRGPIPAKTVAKRAQRERATGFTPAGVAGSAMQDLLQHVVHRHHAEQPSLLFHPQREEVVLGGQLRPLPRPVPPAPPPPAPLPYGLPPPPP